MTFLENSNFKCDAIRTCDNRYDHVCKIVLGSSDTTGADSHVSVTHFHNYVSSDKELYSVYEIKNFYLRINGRWDVWSIIYTSVSFSSVSYDCGNA